MGLYYAKARMYDAENRRFASVDPVKGNIANPMTLVQYVYCVDNGLLYVDSSGKVPILLKYIAAEDKANFSYGFTPHTTLWGLITYKYTVSITIDDKTVEYDYQNIGGNAVIDSDWLVEDFGFNREDVEHQAGDTFTNMSEAALAWSLKYYALSNDKDNPREYGSLIYCNSGLYSFTEPNIGEKDRVQFPHNPENTSVVAGIHSHPDLLFYNSENFSGQVTSNGGDISWVENVRLPLYLATPSGKVKLACLDKNGEVVSGTVYRGIKWKGFEKGKG